MKVDDGNGSRKIVVIVPAYNEERFIGSTVILACRYADVVILVDDGSTDHTAEIAEAAGAVVVRHKQNSGKGVALNTGFNKALEFDPDVVVTIDGDGQHIADEMSIIIAPILNNEADIVVGSRYLENRSEVPKHRILGHWVITLLTNWGSKTSLTDSQSGYRSFSPLAIKYLCISSKDFSVESEMQFLAYRHNLVIKEVPITVFYKDKPKRSAIYQGIIVLNGILQMIGLYRPLLFFGVTGATVLFFGLGLGIMVTNIYNQTRHLAIGYALVTVLSVIVGVLTIFTGITLHSVRELVTGIFRAERSRER